MVKLVPRLPSFGGALLLLPGADSSFGCTWGGGLSGGGWLPVGYGVGLADGLRHRGAFVEFIRQGLGESFATVRHSLFPRVPCLFTAIVFLQSI